MCTLKLLIKEKSGCLMITHSIVKMKMDDKTVREIGSWEDQTSAHTRVHTICLEVEMRTSPLLSESKSQVT